MNHKNPDKMSERELRLEVIELRGMVEIDISKYISELRNYATSFSCQTIDGSNRDFDLTASRVLMAIANSIEHAQNE